MDGASVQDPNDLNETLLQDDKPRNYTFFRKDMSPEPQQPQKN